MAQGTWVLEKCASERFPYRLQILRGDKLWIVLRTQDRWPAAGRHIFCLREDEPPSPDEVLEKLERVDIIAFHERGRRVSVVLDRKRYKRCDFLFLTKFYKGRPGESYEQIFWLTQRSIEQSAGLPANLSLVPAPPGLLFVSTVTSVTHGASLAHTLSAVHCQSAITP